MQRSAVILSGPTASGKSALALAIAREFGGNRHQCRQPAGLS
jgi:tRNA A37 N6-isopentenylltransferase MiaA